MEQPLTCEKCGRENRPGATYCWECFAPFRDAGSPAPPLRTEPRAIATAPVRRPAPPQPTTHVYRGPRTGQHARRFESTPPKRELTGRRVLRGLIRVLTIGLLAAGGVVGYRMATSFLGAGFPSDIAGVPKSLAGGDQLKATIATWRSEVRVQARSQIYSSAINNNQDAFAVVRITSAGGSGATELLRRLSAEGTTTKLPMSRVHVEQVDRVRYTCAIGFDQTTDCLWHAADGTIFIVMGGSSRDYAATLTLVAAAHAAL